MRSCIAAGCPSDANTPGVRFFKFPDMVDKRWIAVCMKEDGWRPSKTHRICSNHFRPDQINGNQIQAGSFPANPFDEPSSLIIETG